MLKLVIMSTFSTNEYCEMVLIYGECGRQARAAQRLYQERFPGKPHPSWQVIVKTVKRFRETGSVTYRPRPGRPRGSGQRVPPEDVLAYALAHPQSSIREISEHCGLAKSRIWSILNELGAHPYRPTSVQALMAGDAQRRYDWCNFIMNRLEVQPTFLADIIWTDEACFSRDTMYNKQNIHFWSLENPRCAVEVRHQVRWSINVWCAIFNNRLIGPVFYEGTLTGPRYLELLTNVISDFLEDLPLSDYRNVWFQHDGAPPHKVSSVQQYLRDTFQQQVIGYGGCVEWPPRSPDLTPLDFFLWGYIKQRVYATPPPTLQELRNRITDACASVSPAMLYNVKQEVQSRVQMCIVAKGHHFEHAR